MEREKSAAGRVASGSDPAVREAVFFEIPLVILLRPVELDLDDFRVPGPARTDLFIGRVCRPPAGVPDGGREHTFDLAESRLDAPETARPEQCLRHGQFLRLSNE